MNKTIKKTNANDYNKLIKKYEIKSKADNFDSKKEMYLKQTDRNYKDGDRN